MDEVRAKENRKATGKELLNAILGDTIFSILLSCRREEATEKVSSFLHIEPPLKDIPLLNAWDILHENSTL